MARQDTEGTITISVLDRLIDRDPKVSTEVPLSRTQALRELRTALRRDLEWLLNTRRSPIEVPEGFTELERSLYNYGLPDISSLSLQSSVDQNRLLRAMEMTLATFEPRLAAVKVTLAALPGGARILRFLIEALLRIDPVPEHISFDTMLELTSGEYAVKGEEGTVVR